MIFSVYNIDTKRYDYLEGRGPSGTHAGPPPITLGRSPLGATPEQAAWRVPAGTVKVGEGELPKGRVAGRGGFAIGGGARLGLMIGAAYVAWRILR